MKFCYFERIGKDGLAEVDLMDGIESLQPMMFITRVIVPEKYRGLGYARSVMKQVLADADAEGFHLMLEVQPSGTSKTKAMSFFQLAQWYKRLGFKWLDEDESNVMFREPRCES